MNFFRTNIDIMEENFTTKKNYECNKPIKKTIKRK